MPKLSEESLNKLTKPELIAFSMNLQEKNESIQHDKKDEVRDLKVCVKKLEEQLALSKNISVRSTRQHGESVGLMLSTLDVSAWEWLEYLKVFQLVTRKVT